jgi:cell division protein FtsW
MIGQSFSRTDQSVLGQWWWTIDRWLLFSIVLLMITGVFLSFAASPPVAKRIGLDSFFFVRRHIFLLIPAFTLMVSVSLLSPRFIRFLCWLLFALFLVFLVLTPFMGLQAKGARRWINLLGFSLQASEFIKPLFAVIAAWLFSQKKSYTAPSPLHFSIGLYLCVISLLLLQPEFAPSGFFNFTWPASLSFGYIFLADLVSQGSQALILFSPMWPVESIGF